MCCFAFVVLTVHLFIEEHCNEATIIIGSNNNDPFSFDLTGCIGPLSKSGNQRLCSGNPNYLMIYTLPLGIIR